MVLHVEGSCYPMRWQGALFMIIDPFALSEQYLNELLMKRLT